MRLLVLLSCSIALVSAQTVPSWLLRAAALQNYIGYHNGVLSQFPFVATHNSYSCDSCPNTHMKAENSNQIYSITQQLKCLGVRGLEIDLHYLQSVQAAPADPGALRVCHVSPDASKQVRAKLLRLLEAVPCCNCSVIAHAPSYIALSLTLQSCVLSTRRSTTRVRSTHGQSAIVWAFRTMGRSTQVKQSAKPS
jgi:hypothetical protein